MSLDTRSFQKALQLYAKATRKDEVEILNRAGRNVAYRAAQKTPTTRAANIRAELKSDDHLAYALTSIMLKKKGVGILKKPQFRKEVSRFISQRAASAGYIRAGWAGAITALGGTYKGKKNRKNAGVGSKATVQRLIAEIINTVPGIDKVGVPALQEALRYVAADMKKYAERKMAQTAKQHSAR